jgi:hypothetical protein
VRRLKVLACTALVLLTAQQGRRYGGREMLCPGPIAIPYTGQWAFARLAFEPSPEAGYGDLKWNHDCPRADVHFAKLLKELTFLNPYMDGGAVFTLDDPELMKYPLAYVSEPGFWTMNDKELANLRAYVLKGGFLIFDDFRDWHLDNFEMQLQRLLPRAQLVPLDVSHPIFSEAFFRIKSLDFDEPYGSQPVYFGVYEDNDPKKRLLLVANYNNDIGEYWEWSDMGYVPIELSNEAYKLGVNYVMYAITH